MRQNSRWAMVPTRYTRLQDDELSDEPLLEEFKVLRRRIFQWNEWSNIEPLTYLGPFLEVIRSPETSGPITGVALTSVRRLLNQYLFGEAASGVKAAMQATAEAITQCKFEATDPAADEVVLYKILQVLLACVKCPGGQLLSHDNILSIFQACFRIGHYQTERSKDMSELLTQASRQVMIEMVALVISRLKDISPEALPPAASHMEVPASNGNLEDGSTSGVSAAKSDKLASTTALASPSLENGDARASEDSKGTEVGLQTFLDLLEFVISLMVSEGEGVHTDLDTFGLELINVALNAGGSAFGRHDSLLQLLRQDVWGAIALAACRPNLATLSQACQVALSLYVHLGRRVLLQVESFLGRLLLPLAEGKAALGIARQEAALEAILDFCNQPRFVHEVFINLDCRIERSNLFEAICTLLSKTAFPVNGSLASVHILSLEGILSILSSLADRCSQASRVEAADASEGPLNIGGVWDALCSGQPPPGAPRRPDGISYDSTGVNEASTSGSKGEASTAAAMLLEKHAKSRLAVAADHFNLDYKKGFQFLQSLGLLSESLDPGEVARFLRHCPGLSKQTIGDLLGENDQFFLDVLDDFTATFNFKGLPFDMAIRLYLESFRLPGEAQKINRIMESFGKHYHEQCPDLFRNADAVYILGYSVILLNTDQHNVGVKKKMTCEEFIRNNRGINGGEDLPHTFLRELYASISQNEIRISADQQQAAAAAAPGDAPIVSAVLWTDLAQQACRPRGNFASSDGTLIAVDRQMFALLWGPTVAAVSVILDHAEDRVVIRQALDGLLLCARIASCLRIDEVLDSLLASLTKYTALLNPLSPKASVLFGLYDKARMATEAVFELANRYGDGLRSGWRSVMDVVVRLHKLGLLPASVAALEGEDAESAAGRLPRAAAPRNSAAAPSLLSRAFSSLISIESSDNGNGAELSAREAGALQATVACIGACHIGELFADSKFLQADSLLELCQAIVHAPGPIPRIVATGDNSDTAEMCLEMVIALSLRNRDRLLLIWPLVHDLLAAILAPPQQGADKRAASPLVARAALGLLRVCQRLLPYKEATADSLLGSLQLLLRLSPAAAWDLAQPIAAEVLTLVAGSAAFIRSAHGWRTVCALITVTCLHPDAAPTALNALNAVARSPALSNNAFMPVLEAIVTCVERCAKDKDMEGGQRLIDMLESLFHWLLQSAKSDSLPDSAEATPVDNGPEDDEGCTEGDRAKLWETIVKVLTRLGTLQMEPLRNQALVILQRNMPASEALGLLGADWAAVLGDLIVPMVGHLAVAVNAQSAALRGAERSLKLAVGLMTKTLLQNLTKLQCQPGFAKLWDRILQVLHECKRNRSELLAEAVPEALKNVLLVMAAQGVLAPSWTDAEGHSLWDLTWYKAHSISANLSPKLLADAGVAVPMPEPPHPQSPSQAQPQSPDQAQPPPVSQEQTPGTSAAAPVAATMSLPPSAGAHEQSGAADLVAPPGTSSSVSAGTESSGPDHASHSAGASPPAGTTEAAEEGPLSQTAAPMSGARTARSPAEQEADASREVSNSTGAEDGAAFEHSTAGTSALSHPGEGAAESVWKSISEAVGTAANAGNPAIEPNQASAPAASHSASDPAHAESDSSAAAAQTADTATAVMAVPASGEASMHDSGPPASAAALQQPLSQSNSAGTQDAHHLPPSDTTPAASAGPVARIADALDASRGGVQEGSAATNVEEPASACKQS
ncbi:g5265 [Coccomyxa elongata]